MTDRPPLPEEEQPENAMITAAFREALPRVPTAVSVVTTLDAGGAAWGVTVGTLCLLSFDPPLVSFSLDRRNASHDVFTGTGRFLVHVLTQDQADVASWFARRGAHDFENDQVTVRGLPSIPGALARFGCRQHALIPGGDHTIVIGLVDGVEIRAGRPLLYYERRYCAVADPASEPRGPAAEGRPVLEAWIGAPAKTVREL